MDVGAFAVEDPLNLAQQTTRIGSGKAFLSGATVLFGHRTLEHPSGGAPVGGGGLLHGQERIEGRRGAGTAHAGAKIDIALTLAL